MKVKLKGSLNNNIVARICENRNVDYNTLSDFLNPDKSFKQNPFIYNNMDKAIRLYLNSIEHNKIIGVLVDSDCDGFCSAALLVNYTSDVLNYSNFRFFIHKEKAHGLTGEMMEEILNSDIDLLVIPDASSGDYEQHKILLDNNIKVIVIDHHLAEKYSENAIVINNQLNLVGNKALSGCGMVLKLLEGLDLLLNLNKSEDYLDLVAIAMVADCIDIVNLETRYYVEKGMTIRNNELISNLYRSGKVINYESISFEVAPFINAFSRVGNKFERTDLFYALINKDETRTIKVKDCEELEVDLISYIKKIGTNVKNRQTSIINKALKSSKTIILTDNLPVGICILGGFEAKDVTGLLANNLVEVYKKPCIVIYQKGQVFKGSGRTTETFNKFKDYLFDTGFFNYCEGHNEAFGLEIECENLEKFIAAITNKSLIKDHDCYLVDGMYKGTVSAYDILAIGELNNSFCKGFEKPLFYIELNNFDSIDIIGSKQNTIRIKHDYITYIKFKCSEEEINLVKNNYITSVEILGTFNINMWNERLYPQVFIDKLEVTELKEKPKQSAIFSFGLNW